MDYALEMLREQRESASKDRAAEIVAQVKALHVDEMSPGTKVSFVKRFSGQREYTYLALKVHDERSDHAGEDLWFVTKRTNPLTNEQFEELLAEKLGFEDFTVLVPAPKPLYVGTWVDPNTEVTGWGADANEIVKAALPDEPASSTHAFGPAEPGEE